MKRQKKFWLAILVSALLALVSACGQSAPATSPSAQQRTIPAGENLYILDGYAAKDQHIVVYHPDGPGTTLPAGLFSVDHKGIYSATPDNGQTTIVVTNALSGTTIRTFRIDGSYSTAGQGYSNAVLSPDGHWLALRQQAQTQATTTIALVDTQAGKLAKTIQLTGNFELDAISSDGNRLYLLEMFNDRPNHYNVRLYEVGQNQLAPFIIVDKNEPNEVMQGLALTRQVAPDGSAVYTLYTDPVRQVAFVHILPLTGDYPLARCIDLPKGDSFDLLRYYTLSMSEDGKTLYAANGALRIAVSIDVSHGDEVFYDTITAKTPFDASKVNHSDNDQQRALYNGASVSADQKTLYFVGVYGIWAASTADLRIQNSYAPQQIFISIALSMDGKTIFAVSSSGGILAIDLASGKTQQISTNSASAPLGIAWVGA